MLGLSWDALIVCRGHTSHSHLPGHCVAVVVTVMQPVDLVRVHSPLSRQKYECVLRRSWSIAGVVIRDVRWRAGIIDVGASIFHSDSLQTLVFNTITKVIVANAFGNVYRVWLILDFYVVHQVHRDVVAVDVATCEDAAAPEVFHGRGLIPIMENRTRQIVSRI